MAFSTLPRENLVKAVWLFQVHMLFQYNGVILNMWMTDMNNAHFMTLCKYQGKLTQHNLLAALFLVSSHALGQASMLEKFLKKWHKTKWKTELSFGPLSLHNLWWSPSGIQQHCTDNSMGMAAIQLMAISLGLSNEKKHFSALLQSNCSLCLCIHVCSMVDNNAASCTETALKAGIASGQRAPQAILNFVPLPTELKRSLWDYSIVSSEAHSCFPWPLKRWHILSQ